MHCPRCGTSATVGQQFCRSCGLNLEKVADLLGKELAGEPPSSNKDLARLRERQRKFEQWGGIAGLITFGLILLTLVVLGILNMILSGSISLAELFLILIAIAAAVMAGFLAYSKSLKQKLANPPLPRPAEPTESGDARNLEAHREPVPTVTDHTTELLTPATGAETGRMDD